ncbi:MAG: ABC transporter substrate-binding protein [Comamonas sp.]
MTVDPTPSLSLIQALAPTGVLRASINLGNPILAGVDPATRQPRGISVDLARELARRLGLPVQLLAWEAAAQSVDAVASGAADIGFFAIDPKRGETLAFTAPYVLIEGSYLVREDSPVRDNAEVDRAGTRITVGRGSAYDLFLSREIRQATLERAPTSTAVVDVFIEQGHDVAAGVRQQLEADSRRLGGLRLLPGRFMVIRQAMGLARARGPAAADALSRFVEDVKSAGFIQEAMRRHGIEGAAVAPPG